MKLRADSLKDKKFWLDRDIEVPSYDIEKLKENTKKAPGWVHFGIGNIFRMFIGFLADTLIESGCMDTGIICAETFDYDIVDKIYTPCDNLVLSVTLKSDGTTQKRILGSLVKAFSVGPDFPEMTDELKRVFCNPSLSIVSFTVTEKGYALFGAEKKYLPYIKKDIEAGPKAASSIMAVVTAMLFERYKNGAYPIAVVSMDNCSRNGEKLKASVTAIASEWTKRGFTDEGFCSYLMDSKKVTFPWTMIDKITPRPDARIAKALEDDGIENMQPVITTKNTYIAPFVNAERPQYLVIEDDFPAGRPPLERAGVYFSDRETVNKAERMKVTACLNPLHTALAVYGCLLGYSSIADEMLDDDLLSLVKGIGLHEGMKVVTDPGIISPISFVTEVIEERLPNKCIPDTPQRIACDTSQKVGIRYGETIKSYVEKFGSAKELEYIPIAIAGWLRYLLGIDDDGNPIELSPDPLLEKLRDQLEGIVIGQVDSVGRKLEPILSNTAIFGIDLYEAGIGKKIESIFKREIEGIGAIRRTLGEIQHI